MPVNNLIELQRSLKQQNFEKVYDTAETSWVDFKKTPYACEPVNHLKLSAKGKFELAKLDDHVYPTPRGVTLTWYPKGEGVEEGVLVILAPKADEGPYIVRHLVDDGGKKIEGVGIPRRNDDRTNWYSAEMLYNQLMRKPPFLQGVDPSMTLLRSDVTRQNEIAKKGEAAIIRDSLVEIQEWGEDPVIILQVVPLEGPARLDKFYDEIRRKLEQPEPIRPMGFGLGALGRSAEAVDGAFILGGMRDTSARLDPDGRFTVVLKVSSDFVGWGMSRLASSNLAINSNVIVEMTYELCRFVRQQLVPNGLKNWTYIVECRNMKGQKVALSPGKPSPFMPASSLASSDQWIREVTPDEDAQGDAFKMLTEVYALFMLADKDIPHIRESKVNEQSIIDLNKNPF